MRRFSARTYLLGLIAVAIIPVWAFAAYLLVSFALAEQRDYREQAVQIARQSAFAVDGKLDDMLIMLDGLARAFDAAGRDFARFHADARRVVAGTDEVVLLRDVSGTQILNTGFQFGSPLPKLTPLSDAEAAAAGEGRQRISDVWTDPADGIPHVSVTRPLVLGNDTYVLEMSIPTSALQETLRGAVPEEWVVGVGDRIGVYVTRSERHEEVSGKPGLPEYIAKATGDSGTFTSPNQFGDVLLAGYVRSPHSGWLYAANVALASVEAPLWSSIYAVLGMAGVALAVSLLLAYLLGRALTGETQRLVGGALALGSRRPVQPVNSRLKEFSLVSDALVRAETMLHERTQELEAVVATAPVAVWFTYDPGAREVIRNRFAAELMGLDGDDAAAHFGRPDRVIDTVAYKDGREVSRDDRPLSRAMRGEHTDNEEFSYVLLNGATRNLMTSARPIRGQGGAVVGAVQVSMDITERKRSEEQLKLLARELNHRVKNNLAIVQAIALQTLRHAETLDEAKPVLIDRLAALGRAHEILTRNAWEAGSLADVVAGSVVVEARADRVTAEGPEIALKSNLVMTLSLALHELGTNALKYGALSVSGGTVDISWQRLADPSRVALTWRERGGPHVAKPEGQGFGTRLLERVTSGEGGTLTLDFDPAGLTATITLPL
ncbi:MAG: PAS domain-containing protein [Rhizobiaceae bacterium]|nr:PAS domain-containing protein [Rhizobiaceae bacterium]